MRVALVNPNRYLEPPVIPVALEYLAHYLEKEGHEVMVIDLAFSPDPEAELRVELGRFDPGAVGFTIRNVDTCLYHDNVFLLGEPARFIGVCRESCDASIVIGGSALLAGPRELADFLGADYAVFGPGERALPSLLSYLERGASPPRLMNGWDSSFDRGEVIPRGRFVDYGPYLRERGIAGFTTQTGCVGRCSFCIEAGLPWRTRSPSAVAGELLSLRNAGCTHLHLCDCEFNQDLDTAKNMLREMIAAETGISWSLYMKPLPHDEALFRLLGEAGGGTVTLSVDSNSLFSGSYSVMDIQTFEFLAHRNGIKVAVDLLVGFPGESPAQVRDVIDFFKGLRPETVGLNAWIRLFKHTGLTAGLRGTAGADSRIEGDDPDYIKPVFYSWLTVEKCLELTGSDPLFRIEGLERRSNYERLR